MKIKLIFAYDGSRFYGSATQRHKKTVQDTLFRALQAFNIKEMPLFASRTDKGVHALNAVALINTINLDIDLRYFVKKLNSYLNPSIHIKMAFVVDDDFEVRFAVKKRQYKYILNHSTYSPFLSQYQLFYPALDLSKTNELLSLFLGENDFKFFQKQGKENTIRTIYKANAKRYKHYTIFTFEANGFLRAQVRLMMSAVLRTLEAKLSKDEFLLQIKAKKEFVRVLAPPNGLYLSRIYY